jgi:chaperonin cofactor prefoldin
MMADKELTEAKLQELEDDIEDLKKQVKELQGSVPAHV